MKTKPQDTHTCNSNRNCSTGTCGGPGLCPGVALLIAYLVGGGIAMLSGSSVLGWTIGIPTALILLSGAWRFLPNRKEA